MATTISDIRTWLEQAEPKHTHMLVVCDTWDHEDYPVYTENVTDAIDKYRSASMQHIMEVYDLRKDHEAQLSTKRVWNA